VTRGQGSSLETFKVPKVKLDKPTIEHLAWVQGGEFLTPKLLLISMILVKFMLVLSLEINLGEIGVKVEKFEHGTELG